MFCICSLSRDKVAMNFNNANHLMSKLRKKAFYWLTYGIAVFVLDQLSKWWAFTALQSRVLSLSSFLNFRLAFNRGAAFSFLSNAGGWQVVFFSVFALTVVIALLVWLWRTPATDKVQALSLSLIIGGALGNVVDRVRLGFVIDFIDFHLGSWHYPTFNVADMGICIGAFLLAVRFLFQKNES